LRLIAAHRHEVGHGGKRTCESEVVLEGYGHAVRLRHGIERLN
jgi:hypothetical protein